MFIFVEVYRYIHMWMILGREKSERIYKKETPLNSVELGVSLRFLYALLFPQLCISWHLVRGTQHGAWLFLIRADYAPTAT